MTTSEITAIVQRSRDFYTQQGLETWARAIPASDTDWAAPLPALQQAQAEGLESALCFPAPPFQRAEFQPLLAAMTTGAVELGGATLTYQEPYLGGVEEMGAAAAESRPDAPYILSFSLRGFPEETRNLNARQTQTLFAAKGWSALTVPEYLVLQRLALTTHGDHRWHDYIGGGQTAQWQWLLDTHTPQGCAAAYWNPKAQRVELYACKVGSKNERRGAHPTRVIPLPEPVG